jgi:hypothetical protein
VSEDACKVCLAARSKVFPIETCTAEKLPPYKDCEYEEGCNSTVTEVLRSEGNAPAAAGWIDVLVGAFAIFTSMPGAGCVAAVIVIAAKMALIVAAILLVAAVLIMGGLLLW